MGEYGMYPLNKSKRCVRYKNEFVSSDCVFLSVLRPTLASFISICPHCGKPIQTNTQPRRRRKGRRRECVNRQSFINGQTFVERIHLRPASKMIHAPWQCKCLAHTEEEQEEWKTFFLLLIMKHKMDRKALRILQIIIIFCERSLPALAVGMRCCFGLAYPHSARTYTKRWTTQSCHAYAMDNICCWRRSAHSPVHGSATRFENELHRVVVSLRWRQCHTHTHRRAHTQRSGEQRERERENGIGWTYEIHVTTTRATCGWYGAIDAKRARAVRTAHTNSRVWHGKPKRGRERLELFALSLSVSLPFNQLACWHSLLCVYFFFSFGLGHDISLYPPFIIIVFYSLECTIVLCFTSTMSSSPSSPSSSKRWLLRFVHTGNWLRV